jgi:hypothetical protein
VNIEHNSALLPESVLRRSGFEREVESVLKDGFRRGDFVSAWSTVAGEWLGLLYLEDLPEHPNLAN